MSGTRFLPPFKVAPVGPVPVLGHRHPCKRLAAPPRREAPPGMVARTGGRDAALEERWWGVWHERAGGGDETYDQKPVEWSHCALSPSRGVILATDATGSRRRCCPLERCSRHPWLRWAGPGATERGLQGSEWLLLDVLGPGRRSKDYLTSLFSKAPAEVEVLSATAYSPRSVSGVVRHPHPE